MDSGVVRNFDSLVVFRPNGGLYGKMRGFSYFRVVEAKCGDLMRFRWKQCSKIDDIYIIILSSLFSLLGSIWGGM